MDFQWIITAKTEKTEVWQKSTPKVSIVVTEKKDQYPASILVDWMWDDKVELVENLKIGSEVAMIFNPRVTEYNDRFYQNNSWYKIEVLSEPVEDEVEDIPFR